MIELGVGVLVLVSWNGRIIFPGSENGWMKWMDVGFVRWVLALNSFTLQIRYIQLLRWMDDIKEISVFGVVFWWWGLLVVLVASDEIERKEFDFLGILQIPWLKKKFPYKMEIGILRWATKNPTLPEEETHVTVEIESQIPP
jgi:hypothetical protein